MVEKWAAQAADEAPFFHSIFYVMHFAEMKFQIILTGVDLAASFNWTSVFICFLQSFITVYWIIIFGYSYIIATYHLL